MEEQFSTLYNVPELIATESMSSWISRLSLSQGISPSALLNYLDIDQGADLDYRVGRINLSALYKKTGMKRAHFKGIRSVFNSLEFLGRKGRNFLLFSGSKSRYRFCPICLEQDDYPYFRIEWRFKIWHVCPLHKCFLEDQCIHCNAPVTLPVNMLSGGYKNMGIGNLAMCHSCGKLLSKVTPAFIEDHPYLRLNPEDTLLIQNSRALLSALYLRRYKLCGFRTNYPLADLYLHPGLQPPYWDSFKWNAELWRSMTLF
jgi:TniQ